MPHNMLATMITELKLTDTQSVISSRSDTVLELKALSILDEQVRDAANELTDAQANLADMTTAYKAAQTNLTEIIAQIQTHESYALQALNQENHALALEVAEKIASLEQSHAEIAAAATHHANQCEKLTDMLHQNEHNLYVLKQQIDTIKANQSVHRAQLAVCERYGDLTSVHSGKREKSQPKLRTALNALADMNAKAVKKMPTALSVSESNNQEAEKQDDLLLKLQAAGIASGNKKAEDVLARIKNKT